MVGLWVKLVCVGMLCAFVHLRQDWYCALHASFVGGRDLYLVLCLLGAVGLCSFVVCVYSALLDLVVWGVFIC